jgi:NADH:ubiquinone reductase (non-electrogenic)
MYLAKALNHIGKEGAGRRGGAQAPTEYPEFVYRHLGSMASLGSYKALVDLRQGSEVRNACLNFWRSIPT